LKLCLEVVELFQKSIDFKGQKFILLCHPFILDFASIEVYPQFGQIQGVLLLDLDDELVLRLQILIVLQKIANHLPLSCSALLDGCDLFLQVLDDHLMLLFAIFESLDYFIVGCHFIQDDLEVLLELPPLLLTGFQVPMLPIYQLLQLEVL
jgi:hypothetical protein